jgi:putative membrane protein
MPRMARKVLVAVLVLLLAGLVAVPVAAGAATHQPGPPSVAAPAASDHDLSELDRLFMVAAAQSGLFEIQSSTIALDRSHNRHVRQFARRMIRDHTRQAAELAALAAAKGVTLPDRPNAAQQVTLLALAQLSGREFDCSYITAQIVGHIETITVFRAEARFGADPDVRAFAHRSLPLLRMHLRLAKRVAARLHC